ncbi:hypothetical protein [uncultured Vibrio sp.]|uniref:hypothetical protein n=1 Tax=uncultured Vibrio sp. TaxID=114054 RepID=UPI0026243103|nr:hypothetical protein [uncultured Vibrio sp.]
MTTSNSPLKYLEHHNQLTDAVACDESIPADEKSLLIAISTFFNLANQCAFPSRKQIAARMGRNINYVTELISKAKKSGRLISTAQFIQIEGESAPRQIANKYEFVLEKLGLFYSKAKAMLNRNLRKKSKKNKATQQAASSRVDHINQILDEAHTTDIPEWEDYSPPD